MKILEKQGLRYCLGRQLTRYGWLCLALLGILAAAPPSLAYTFVTGSPQPVRDRPFYFNPDSCDPRYLDDALWAAEMWNFYSPARLRYAGETRLSRPARDDRDVILCADTFTLMEKHQKSMWTRGFTSYWYKHGSGHLTNTDIVFNTDWYTPRSCTFAHEFGHALGLGHSDFPSSAMQSGSDCVYLSADDIAGISALYGVPANCTPYATEDRTLYFPHVAGLWVELTPADVVDGHLAFALSKHGEAVGADWECDLTFNTQTQRVDSPVYWQGETFDISMQFRDGYWLLTSFREQQEAEAAAD